MKNKLCKYCQRLLIIGVFFLNLTVYSQDITTGLMLHYDFEEIIEKSVPDKTTSGLDGVLQGGSTVVTGYNGKAVKFSSSTSNTDYILLPTGFNKGLYNFTVATWVKVDAYLGNNSRIFDFGTGTNAYMLLTPKGTDGKLRFGITTGSYSTEQTIDGPGEVPVGVWTHIAFTLSGSTGRLYVNGQLVATKTNFTLTPNALPSTTQNYIARSQWAADPAFQGSIDDFRIYNRAFTSSDIDELVFDRTQLLSELQTAITLAESFANPTSALLDAINASKDVLSNPTSATQIIQAIKSLNETITAYRYQMASKENPLDVTSFINNPSFESSFTGWTNNGMAIQNNTAFPLKHGNNYSEIWVNRGSRVPDVGVQQLLTNIPNGIYTLIAATGNIQQSLSNGTINATATPQTGAFLYAENKSVAVDTFTNRSVSFVVLNNKALIGFKTLNATGNWVTLDNFRLSFEGYQLNDIAAFVDGLILEAQTLLPEIMLNSHRQSLLTAIGQGQQAIIENPLLFESLKSAHTNLIQALSDVRISINACSKLQEAINVARTVYGNGSGNEAQLLYSKILSAEQVLVLLEATVAVVNETTSTLNQAVFAYRLANASGTVPRVVTNTNFVRGATAAFGRSIITGVLTSNLAEHGFCWSTHPEPTVLDNRSTKLFSSNGNVYHIQNLQPSTVYYMRAYAMTNDYAVGYGDVIRVITIPKGTITYQLNASVTSAEGHHERIAEAMRSAVDYWNNLTSIQGKHLSINYHPGTPTAEASYNGYMQFGANSTYQRTGTALHEMGHNIGVGTHSMWYGPSSPLRAEGSRGTWLGERANNVLRFLDNNPNATLTGDAVHMWPFGINGAHEDSGSEFVYIANSLITQGLVEDGLPPTGGFAVPAYTFSSLPDVKYYIKSEGSTTGRSTSYLIVDQAGRIANVPMRGADALANDSAAWYLDFNPANSYYRIRNVATGKYFTYVTTGVNGITLASRTTPGASENFQLMGSRLSTQVGTYTGKAYWIVRPQHTLNPPTFTALQSTSTSATTFNFENSATTQRWLIMTESNVNDFEKANTTDVKSIANSSIKIFADNEILHIHNLTATSEITVYTVTGVAVLKSTTQSSAYSHYLPKGLYIVEIVMGGTRYTEKIILN